MQNQFTEKGCDRRGAFMGRSSSPEHVKPVGAVRLWPVYVNSQGYDDNGAYWGTGGPLWCAEDESGDFRQFTRADTYAEAVAALRLSPSQLARDYEKEFAIFLQSYLDAVLFTETNDEDEPLDGLFTPSDIEAGSLAEAEKDCRDFLAKGLNGKALADFLEPDEMAQAGHDFWLTRNGHGAGFWGRPVGMYRGQGKALSEIARGFCIKSGFAEDGKVFIE